MDRRQLFLTHHENQASELLLEQLNPRAPKAQQEAAAQANPLWNWPEPFRLDFPTFVLDRECLWMLHPRILPWGSGSNPDSEPIRFADARHATLLRFERGLTNAVQIPIEFRKDGQPADIFGFRHVLWNSYALRYLTLINSEEGLIVISSSHRGHWLIPRSEVSRWKSSTASNGERDVAQKHLPAAAVNNTNRIKAVTP